MNNQTQGSAAKGGGWKTVAIGCVGAMALTCLAGVGAAWFVGDKVKGFFVGTVVARVEAPGNGPFALPAVTPGSDGKVSLWIDMNVTQNAGPLTGSVEVTSNGSPVATYALVFQGRGTGCFNPTVGSSSSMCINFSEVGHALRGRIFLFDLPSSARGTSVVVRGSLLSPPGTTVNRAEFQLRK